MLLLAVALLISVCGYDIWNSARPECGAALIIAFRHDLLAPTLRSQEANQARQRVADRQSQAKILLRRAPR